jgi:hypothetical protein
MFLKHFKTSPTVDGTYIVSSFTNLLDLELSVNLVFAKIDRFVPGVLHWPTEKIMTEIRFAMKDGLMPVPENKRSLTPFFVHYIIQEKDNAILLFCNQGVNIDDFNSPDFSFCYR